MKAIHGGKTKNDKIDSHKIALLLRGGMMPMAYAYPQAMRATRDLLRRRMQLMRVRTEAMAHIQNSVSQYNLPPLAKKLSFAANRQGVAEQFPETSARRSVEVDLALIDHLDGQLQAVELYLVRHAKVDDAPRTAAGRESGGPQGEEVRQVEGAVDSGRQDRPRRVLDAQAQGGVRCEPLLQPLNPRRRRVSRKA
jgi:hypothetical protein